MILTLIAFVSLGFAVEKYSGPHEIKDLPLYDLPAEQSDEILEELEEMN